MGYWIMARPNMPKKVRVKCYPLLLKVWPEVCSNCQKTCHELNINPFDDTTGTGGLEIHHTRYDVSLSDPYYQRLMCHACNHLKEFSYSELERYDQEVSASMKSNIDKHQIFAEWISQEMIECNFRMPYSEAAGSGAYISGANYATVERWLKPLISKAGPFSRATIDGVDTIYVKGKSFTRPPMKDLKGFVDVGDFNKDVDKLPKKDED